MRFTLVINQSKSLEWGLNYQQAALFSCLYELQSWGKHEIIDGQPYYWAAKNKIIEEIPLIFDKPDTLKRHLIALEKAGLIEKRQYKNLPYIRITEKGKLWNETEQNRVVKKITTSENKDDRVVKKITTGREKDHGQVVKKITTISIPNKYTSISNTDPEQVRPESGKPVLDEKQIIEYWNSLGCQKHRGVSQAASKAIQKTYETYCKAKRKEKESPQEITNWAMNYLKHGFAMWMTNHHRQMNDGQWCADLEFAMRFSTYDKIKNTEISA